MLFRIRSKRIEVRDDQMRVCEGLTVVAVCTLLPSSEGMIDDDMEPGFSDQEFYFTTLFEVVLYNFEPFE